MCHTGLHAAPVHLYIDAGAVSPNYGFTDLAGNVWSSDSCYTGQIISLISQNHPIGPHSCLGMACNACDLLKNRNVREYLGV